MLDLLERSPRAVRDGKFYVQLSDAASSVATNVAEGFFSQLKRSIDGTWG